MEFGLFMPPMHYPQQNPTRALHRDLETLTYADTLGFKEAWIGEHHSGGYEYVTSPEVFIAAAIERTQHMRIGSGVASLPYHHPYHVAERAVLLDHLSRGRTMLGVGPGSLPTDAHMLGVPWSETRKRMVEAWEAIYHLLTNDEPLTMETDWFTLRDAQLQLSPYSDPTMEIAFTAMESPFGPSLAGKYGSSLISLSGLSAKGFASLANHWNVVEEQAVAHNQVVDRSNWGVVAMIHVAETREQAKREVEKGLPGFAMYSGAVSERTFEWLEPEEGAPVPEGPPSVDDLIAAFGGTQIACIGTPDDAIEMISNMAEMTGGFGKLLLFSATDWTSQEANFRGLELFAREVMPAFQGSNRRPMAFMERAMASREAAVAEQRASIQEAQASYTGTKES
ncbi:MAG: LLM class flavin-dependent oxidoreductase [Actinobacteria bacterium]|nr:LLM class flavin-dependent oxidoreductase [Actinomycetota bacterium]